MTIVIIALICVVAVAVAYLLLRWLTGALASSTGRENSKCPECGAPLSGRDEAWLIERSVQILRMHDSEKWPVATSGREIEGWKALACGHRVELVVDNEPDSISVHLEPAGGSTPAPNGE